MAQAAAPNSSIARRSFCSFIEFFPLGRILRAGPGHFFINVMSVCPHQPAPAAATLIMNGTPARHCADIIIPPSSSLIFERRYR
jgi:hypothetical protein